jgi:hypothetical protein
MSWRDVIRTHPAAELFPLMSPGELKALGEDIRANGLSNPIVLWGSAPQMLIDGRNRLDAMELAGLPTHDRVGLKVSTRLAPSQKDPIDLVVSLNIHRRHLTGEQKRDLIEKLLKAKPEQSDRAIAGMAKVSDKTVGKVRDRLEAGAEIPHLDKRTGADGKAQPASKPKSTVPLDDLARPRNRADPIAERAVEALRTKVDEKVAEATEALRNELQEANNELKTAREGKLKLWREAKQLRATVRSLQCSIACQLCGAPTPTPYVKDGPLLDPKWFGKFSKFVGMLGSDNETERHLAADHAHKLLAEANLRWSDLL